MNECVDKTSAPWRWEWISREAGYPLRGGIKRRWCGNPLPRVGLLLCLAERRQLRLLSVRNGLRQRCQAQLSLLVGGVSGWDALLRRPGKHPHPGDSAKSTDCRYVLNQQKRGLTRALFLPHRHSSCLQVHSRQASVPMKSLVPPPRSSTSLTWTAPISSPCRSSPETICTTSATGWWVVKGQASLEYSVH